jgi:hypothetical protein
MNDDKLKSKHKHGRPQTFFQGEGRNILFALKNTKQANFPEKSPET